MKRYKYAEATIKISLYPSYNSDNVETAIVIQPGQLLTMGEYDYCKTLSDPVSFSALFHSDMLEDEEIITIANRRYRLLDIADGDTRRWLKLRKVVQCLPSAEGGKLYLNGVETCLYPYEMLDYQEYKTLLAIGSLSVPATTHLKVTYLHSADTVETEQILPNYTLVTYRYVPDVKYRK